MSIDIDGIIKVAMAKIALTIERTAGPVNAEDPISVAAHQERITTLEQDVTFELLKEKL